MYLVTLMVCVQIAFMNHEIELEQETDGRWIAEIVGLSGVLVYGNTPEDALKKVQVLAFEVESENC